MVFTTIDSSLTPAVQNNILDNAGLEIWQRGTTFSNPTGYTADRWAISTSCTTYSIAQEATIIDSGVYSMKLVITTPAGGVFRIDQSLENPAQYVGKVMTFSARVWSNVAGVKLFVSYVGGQTASTAAHTGNSTWQTLSMTLTIPASGITLCVGFDSVNTTVGSSISPVAGTFYLDSCTFVYGPNAAAFIPLPLQQDLARCQRFFYATPAVNNVFICHGQCQTSTIASCVFKFTVPMRAAPTLTVNNATNFATWNSGGVGIALTSLVNAGSANNTDFYLLEVHVASGLVAGNATSLFTQNANAQIFFSADL